MSSFEQYSTSEKMYHYKSSQVEELKTENMRLCNEIERLRGALERISEVGIRYDADGEYDSTHYTGENHAECLKIARQALEGKIDGIQD